MPEKNKYAVLISITVQTINEIIPNNKENLIGKSEKGAKDISKN